MPFCPKCGKEVKEDAVFCPYCGETLKPQQEKVVYRRARDEINEKNEKGEKNEKDEKGGEKSEKGEKNEGAGGMWSAVMGGLILLWLGVTFLLQQYNLLTSINQGALFMMGLGVIIALRGLLFYTQVNNWRAASGLIIGGAVVALIGVSSWIGWREWWPFVIILVGAWIVLNAVMSRNKNPKP